MLSHDLRYAVRSLRQSPTFVAVAVGTLGLALGLCTTMFAILDAVVHPYVPFRDPEKLYWIGQYTRSLPRAPTAAEAFALLREGTHSFESIAGISHRMAMIGAPNGAASGSVAVANENVFDILGVRPALGRLFHAGGGSGARDTEAAVVTEQTWRRVFPGRTSLDGAVVSVDDQTIPVIGVLPRGFGDRFGADVWLPASRYPSASGAYIAALGRLKPGVMEDQARAELSALAERVNRERGLQAGVSYRLVQVRFDPQRLREFHFAMAGAALVVFLIACANLANLMLVRGEARRREVAVRIALGATRGAIARQTLAECALVAAAGATLGLVVAVWSTELAVKLMPHELSFVGILQPYLSWRVVAFALLAATVTILTVGLVPALRPADAGLAQSLSDGAATTQRIRRYSFIVMGEVGLAMTLLMGTGLLARAARRVSHFDFGYETRGLIDARAFVRRPSELGTVDVARAHDEVLARARQIPGVSSAATIAGAAADRNVATSELAEGGTREGILRGYYLVSPDALRTFGIPVIAGRDFSDGDRRSGAGVAIVDQAVARRWWPGSDPVGRMIKLGDAHSAAPWLPVIGVARTAWLTFPREPDALHAGAVYVVPPAPPPRWRLVARLSGDRGPAAMALSRAVAASLPQAQSVLVSSWIDDYDTFLTARRFIAGLFAVFAVIALALACVGLYGVLAYAVSRRTREFSVRLALGAAPRDVMHMVAHDAAVMTLAGIGVGAFAAMAAGTLLGFWIWDLHPADAVSLVGAELALAVGATAAALIPALRAASVSPASTLRAT